MSYWIEAAITPKAAAKLLLSSEIDITGRWKADAAQKVFLELLELPIEDILKIIDCNSYGNIADIKFIPQFGKVDTVIHVPYYFESQKQSSADYPQMGFFLKKDISATLVANTKFGENHGKAASILGLANCVNKRIVPSVFTGAFCELNSEIQKAVLRKLMFRVPIVQIILKTATEGICNGYEPMAQLKESTMKRRGQCIRTILKELKEYEHAELSARIENIVWESSGGELDAEV